MSGSDIPNVLYSSISSEITFDNAKKFGFQNLQISAERSMKSLLSSQSKNVRYLLDEEISSTTVSKN